MVINAGGRGLAAKAVRMALAGVLAAALALQLASPGSADTEAAPPSEPSASAGPATPEAPASPAEPTAPASPAEPTAPASPVEPTAPASPVEPTAPAGPPDSSASPRPAITDLAADAAAPLTVRLEGSPAFVGKPFTGTLQITGGTAPYTVTATDVPDGLVFNPANLSFTGTPTREYSPSPSVSITDSSDPQQTLTQQVRLEVMGYYPPGVYVTDGELLPGMGTFDDGVVGRDYAEYLEISGADREHAALSVVSGHLPPGLELRDGAVAGVPSAAGKYQFSLRAQDRFDFTDSSYEIIVHALGMQTKGYDVPPAVLGEPYSAKIAEATGGVAPYVYGYSTRRHFAGGLSYSDPWPEGLSVDANGFLTGTPTRPGSFSIAVWVRDADQLTQRIFWTTVTVLETRPPVTEQPPAADPPVEVEVPGPPAAVLPAGSLESTSEAGAGGYELAATGLQSGTLNELLWAAAGLLASGALFAAASGLSGRRGGRNRGRAA